MAKGKASELRLAGLSIRLRLYIALGALIIALLIVGGTGIASNVITQQLVNRAVIRQRQLADLASGVNHNLLVIQNIAFVFQDDWRLGGFEKVRETVIGFEQARQVYLYPIQAQLQQVRDDTNAMLALTTNKGSRANLNNLLQNVDAYETTLLAMSEQMETLGYQESGEMGQLWATLAQLNSQLADSDLVALQSTLFQIQKTERDFFLLSDVVYIGPVSDLIIQLKDQIAATDDAQLAPEAKEDLTTLLAQYEDHFLAATTLHRNLRTSRDNLLRQTDLAGVLVSRLLEQQQTQFSVDVAQIQTVQQYATAAIIGLSLLFLVGGSVTAYSVAGQIIRPIQELGEAAERLGAGELGVRAAVHGRDEISLTATAFNSMADRLQGVLAGLEQQVADRTRDIEQRSRYLEAAAEVGRAATSILETDQLMNQVVELIRERFDLYYVGLFLVGPGGAWAELRAGTGEAGRTMLSRSHRIKVGEGMIGWSVAHAEARIALEAGEDAVRLATAELPETRSEGALPLRSRGQTLGALSVQSASPGAFDPDTIAVLQTMADQVAVALDNARLFVASQEALEAERRAYGELGREAWTRMARARPDWGYRCDQQGVFPSGGDWQPEMAQAAKDGRTTLLDDGATPAVAIPLRVRAHTVGALNFRKVDKDATWTAEEIALIETLTEQLGLALESARLYQDTQRRAARERLLGEVAARMRETLDVDTVLQTAIREIGDALGIAEVEVWMGRTTPSEPRPSQARVGGDGRRVAGSPQEVQS